MTKPYVVMTDSACDMPTALEKSSGVHILNFGITVDGQAFTEREDFTFDEYYEILRNCQGIPTTAHITQPRFVQAFEAHAAAGVKQLLYVSINAGGSATHSAALMAKQQFLQDNPACGMEIFIVDSHTYSMAYGWFVAAAAEKLAAGTPMEEVVAWLQDTFARVEIILGAYSLRFMKKSGRISAAAAFAGELLGLRPIISLNDGQSVVQQKVRGDKDVLPALLQHAATHRTAPAPYLVGGTDDDKMRALCALCTEAFGAPPSATFQLGAAVATNTGPDAIAIVYLGEERAR